MGLYWRGSNVGALGSRRSGCKAWLTHKSGPPPHVGMSNLILLSNAISVRMEICRKMSPSRLAFISMDLSRFQMIIRQFRSKKTRMLSFHTPVFNPFIEVLTAGVLHKHSSGSKTTMISLLRGEKKWRNVHSCSHWTWRIDRQTDGHTSLSISRVWRRPALSLINRFPGLDCTNTILGTWLLFYIA